jgi:hypothetical protein
MKFMKKCGKITNFKQGDNESLCDACEHFKLLLKWCPCHEIDEFNQMQIFKQGLKVQTMMLLNSLVGGTMKTKLDAEAKDLVENVGHNEYMNQNNLGTKTKGIFELDTHSALMASHNLMASHFKVIFGSYVDNKRKIGVE